MNTALLLVFVVSFVGQKNLVGQRGLVDKSDQQTFRIAIQRQLRVEYNRILMPISTAQVQPYSHV